MSIVKSIDDVSYKNQGKCSFKQRIDQVFILQQNENTQIIDKMEIQTKIQNIFLIYFLPQLIFSALHSYLQMPKQYNFQMQQAIIDYLRSPHSCRRTEGKQNRNFAYLLTYLGQLFIQGYRLIQNYGSILLFSLMEFQFSDNQSIKIQRKQSKIPTRFKVMLWEMKVQNILGNDQNRRKKFELMTMIGSLLDEVQYHIIYLQEFRFSIVQQQLLENNGLPLCLLYFKKIKWMDYQNGITPINDRKEGRELHLLIQIFIKGAGQAQNQEQIKKLQNKYEFNYNLFKTINTVCYIVGKQMLQNGFQTITCQKWMRRYSKKNFRRYDLVMRNEQKSMIIDWKFTILTALQKSRHPKDKKKNEMYCQLARKDFKNQIQFRFYCISRATQNNYYHHFTSANFEEQKLTIDLDGKIYEDYSQISILDSESEDFKDYFSNKNLSDQQKIINDRTDCINIIEISSKEEIQVNYEQIQIVESNESKKMRKAKKKKQMIWPQNFLLKQRPANTRSRAKAKKIQIKNDKRAFKNLIRFPIQVLEIQSD